MRRVLVTGNAGSGKTTLSKHLAARLDLPLVHLDQFVWQPGWRKTPKAELDDKLAPVLEAPAWIIDGVSTRACLAADTIILLDLPLRTCLVSALRRTFRYLFSQRPELPRECPEAKITADLIRILFHYHRETRPKLLSQLSKLSGEKRVHRLTTRAEVASWLAALPPARL